MKPSLIRLIDRYKNRKYYMVYNQLKEFTMTPIDRYVLNLILAEKHFGIPGCFVECGTWRGGLVAGIAKLCDKSRSIYLFDSFEGLPKAELIDGYKAINYQNDVNSPSFFDNCKAEVQFAENAMEISEIKISKL